MWDPNVYGRFGDERSRPFHELVARIPVAAPRQVVDLGCGPGVLTVTLAERWPDAVVRGIDSSTEMIASARALGSRVDFALGDLRDVTPAGVDVLVSNAALQWVPDHLALLDRWVGAMEPGAWLAFQVPGNFASPAHDAVYALAADPRWAPTLGGVVRRMPVPSAAAYATRLTSLNCAVDAWETTYVHVLPGGADHPVLAWLEGTALRPVRAAFGAGADSAGWSAYRAELGEWLAEAYPLSAGRAFFPFRRVFVVAQIQGASS
ncbi:methyltransferase domain-containing protein [Asanoa siamensis]|uniref:Trans-aconitate 2-methyltransferase n=1 Tax=Asanoa siamensis TaxID=926357 RepID=A0ABQ4CSY2_9ACTN|nr:methyltransferase domain-containing protein [Asanoa siamensis]GIF74395.1 trans-aconitate 2-methyltransferase [Asanoa siamensis]